MASLENRNDKWEYRIRYKEMGNTRNLQRRDLKQEKEAQLALPKLKRR